MTPSSLDQVAIAAQPGNLTTIVRMNSGFVVMGNCQFWPGYCLLLAYPKVGALNDLPTALRNAFLADLGLLGEAVEKVCVPRRVNYAILGNQDPFLHAHVIPRYEWEAESLKTATVWSYPATVWSDVQHTFSIEKHGQLQENIRQQLLLLMQ